VAPIGIRALANGIQVKCPRKFVSLATVMNPFRRAVFLTGEAVAIIAVVTIMALVLAGIGIVLESVAFAIPAWVSNLVSSLILYGFAAWVGLAFLFGIIFGLWWLFRWVKIGAPRVFEWSDFWLVLLGGLFLSAAAVFTTASLFAG